MKINKKAFLKKIHNLDLYLIRQGMTKRAAESKRNDILEKLIKKAKLRKFAKEETKSWWGGLSPYSKGGLVGGGLGLLGSGAYELTRERDPWDKLSPQDLFWRVGLPTAGGAVGGALLGPTVFGWISNLKEDAALEKFKAFNDQYKGKLNVDYRELADKGGVDLVSRAKAPQKWFKDQGIIDNMFSKNKIGGYLSDPKKFKNFNTFFKNREMYNDFLHNLRNYIMKGMEGRGKEYGMKEDTWRIMSKLNPETFIKTIYGHK